MRRKPFLSRFKTLLTPLPKRFNHTECSTTDLSNKTKTKYAPPDSSFGLGEVGTSKWKTLDSRRLGVDLSMIPESSWSVMETLRRKGFEVYLVGGCVRDLLLNRRPKDFDVITSAALKQVRQHFQHSEIVGQRFPICLIHYKGTVIEVSSFQTMPEHTIDRERFVDSQMPRSCSKSDLVIWKDTMRRDFTINSLFFNPFANKIYDYANGLVDLRSLKLRTLIPAHLSFTEDSARILRGVRVAARLGLSLSKETEIAMRELSLSILDISKFRLMMELNYMLSYGAAEPSLDLLHRIGMLENLLPFHAAYLTHHASKYGQSDTMLMKLFFSLDRLVSCDQPSTSVLWVSLLAFHLALVEKPQHPIVVLTLASLLYYGKWTDAVHFARQHAQTSICYEPEILEAGDVISDDELAEKVILLLSLIKDSSSVLSDVDSLHERMSSFPDFRYHGLVFISRLTTKNAVSFFEGAEGYINSNKKQCRANFRINYNLLRKKNKRETKFVIGRIIMDTMVGDVKKQTMSSSSNPQLQEVTAEKQKLNVELRTHLKHKSINEHLADGVKGSEEIPQIMRGSVMKTDCQEATKYRMEMAGKENVGSSQNYIAKNVEKFSSSQLTIGKDLFEREEKDCQQVWESKNQKLVEINEEMERLRFLASQEEKLQKPVNHHLHPSNVSEQQVGRCTTHTSKEKRTQRPLSDLFK